MTSTSPLPAAGALADFAIALRVEEVDRPVRDAAIRALANVVGVSIGGVPLEASQRAQATMGLLGGAQQARVLGTGHPGPVDRVALVDGVLAHVLDYDDTDLETIHHPSAPVLAGVLPLAEWRGASGRQLLRAWIVGLETGIRTARALGSAHYDTGWHVTGTAGVVASAAACATLLKLDRPAFVNALGIAATQASGHREQFGYMTKALHVGAAGQAGLLAALLAQSGYDASPDSLDGRRGMLAVMSSAPDPAAFTEALGEHWVLTDNCLKPYACGVVTHAAIDGTRALRDEGITSDDVAAIELHVHPLVVELTGKDDPQTGLEGKFSVRHCAAMGLLSGIAGPRQFADDVVTSPEVADLRARISVHASAEIAHMTAVVRATLRDGTEHELRVDPARGTPGRPLTDPELEAKFIDAATVVLAHDQSAGLWRALLDIEAAPEVSEIVTQTIPAP